MRWGLGLLMSMALVAQVPGPPLPGKGPLPPKTPAVLWKALPVRGPFLGSMEAKEEPQSLNRFFGPKDYPKLQGNPALGFYDADGFRWVGRRVAWLGVRQVYTDWPGVPAGHWDRAFESIARSNHWKMDPSAPIRVKGACVGAVATTSAQEPQIGVCLELQLSSPTGTLLYRYAIAQPSLAEAVHQALEWTLSCARDLDQINPKGAKHGPAQP